MALRMDRTRVEELKCEFCGSKHKKVVKSYKNAGDEHPLGYSLVCCSCGHVNNFAVQYEAIPLYCGAVNGSVSIKSVVMECGACSKLLDECPIENCPARPLVKPGFPQWSGRDTAGTRIANKAFKDRFAKPEYQGGENTNESDVI